MYKLHISTTHTSPLTDVQIMWLFISHSRSTGLSYTYFHTLLSSQVKPAQGILFNTSHAPPVKWLFLCNVVANLITVHSALWFIQLHPPAPQSHSISGDCAERIREGHLAGLTHSPPFTVKSQVFRDTQWKDQMTSCKDHKKVKLLLILIHILYKVSMFYTIKSPTKSYLLWQRFLFDALGWMILIVCPPRILKMNLEYINSQHAMFLECVSGRMTMSFFFQTRYSFDSSRWRAEPLIWAWMFEMEKINQNQKGYQIVWNLIIWLSQGELSAPA